MYFCQGVKLASHTKALIWLTRHVNISDVDNIAAGRQENKLFPHHLNLHRQPLFVNTEDQLPFTAQGETLKPIQKHWHYGSLSTQCNWNVPPVKRWGYTILAWQGTVYDYIQVIIFCASWMLKIFLNQHSRLGSYLVVTTINLGFCLGIFQSVLVVPLS